MMKMKLVVAGAGALAGMAAFADAGSAAKVGGETVEIVSEDGGKATVAAYGGRVVSWRPAGGCEVFAMAWPYADCRRGEQIHGGLPMYWPWFVFEGPEGCKIHGLTCYADWKVKSRSKSRVVLELEDSEETRAAWPHKFHAELEYSLSDGRLDGVFRVTNTDDAAYRCTEGFHPYFNVGDVRECTISGTDGLNWFCKAEAEKGDSRTWSGDFPCRIPHEKGAGYVIEEKSPEGKHLHVLSDPVLRRSIDVEFEGNIKIVVFNSGDGFDGKFGPASDPDFGRHFVCLEGATLYRDRAYTLKPGETHVLKVAVQPK